MVKTSRMVKSFRENDDTTPIVLMGYYNPIYVYGWTASCTTRSPPELTV